MSSVSLAARVKHNSYFLRIRSMSLFTVFIVPTYLFEAQSLKSLYVGQLLQESKFFYINLLYKNS